MKIPHSAFLFYSIILIFNAKLAHSNENEMTIRSSNSNLYREEFETYETLQRGRNQSQRKTQSGGLRTRYVEFAETEYSRPSYYFPIPFLLPVNNKLQMIPARTMSQLIRQHIAHTRRKQLALQNVANNQILQGVRQITELRQTPFRQWPQSNFSTYEEKRRQWKAEIKRRLQSHKVPVRIIPPLLISGGGRSSIQTDREPDDRYFVTYSPQTRIYQVSRKPPPFLYTTDRDTLPEQLIESVDDEQVTAEPTYEKSAETTVWQQEIGTSPESYTSNFPINSSTTTKMSVMIVLQEANIVVDDQEKEHKERVVALQRKKMSKKVGKQILFLDDYEQDGEDEEDVQLHQTTMIPQASSPRIELEIHSSPTTNANRMRELEEARERLREQLFQQNTDNDNLNEEDDDEDDDLFFFKPGSGQDQENEPFQILVHGHGRHKII